MSINAIVNQICRPGQCDKQLSQAASEFVNNVFYGTLLRQFREAQEPGIFDGGRGGKIFERQLDMELIKRISQRGDAPMADAVIKQLSRKTGEYDTKNV